MSDQNKIPPGQTKLAYERGATRFSMGNRRAPTIVKVVKYTPKQVVCLWQGQELRFDLADGRERGGNYGAKVMAITPDIVDEIKKEKLVTTIASEAYKIEEKARKVAQKDYRSIDVPVLNKIIILLESFDLQLDSIIGNK